MRTTSLWLLALLLCLVPLRSVQAGWVDRFDGTLHDSDEGLATVVTGGAVFVAGRTTERVGVASGIPRGFVARHDAATGSRVWTLVYGASEGADVTYSCHAILAAPDGDLLVGCSRGYGAIAVLRVTPDGVVVWVRTQSACLCLPNFGALALDPAGNVYLAGKGPSGALVTGFDAAGGELGTWQYPMALEDLVIDGDGFVYLAGSLPVPNLASEAAVVKFAPGGGLVWQRTFGALGPFANDGFSTLTLSGSRLLASGGFGYNEATGSDALVIALDPDGGLLWQFTHDGAASAADAFLAARAAADGSLYLAGYETAATGGLDALVVRLDAAGGALWHRTLAGPGGWDDLAWSLALAPGGGVAVAGGERLLSGDRQYLYARFDASGQLLDRNSYGGPLAAGTGAWSVAVDALGHAYLTGGSFGTATGSDIATVRFDHPTAIFSEGFESGNLASWGLVVGQL
jgi:PQQ-like domain